jgi:hypothetical protein
LLDEVRAGDEDEGTQCAEETGAGAPERTVLPAPVGAVEVARPLPPVPLPVVGEEGGEGLDGLQFVRCGQVEGGVVEEGAVGAEIDEELLEDDGRRLIVSSALGSCGLLEGLADSRLLVVLADSGSALCVSQRGARRASRSLMSRRARARCRFASRRGMSGLSISPDMRLFPLGTTLEREGCPGPRRLRAVVSRSRGVRPRVLGPGV